MLIELLRVISRGSSSVADIAAHMNLRLEEVRNKIEMLHHMGYLREISTKEQLPQNACYLCAFANTCSLSSRRDTGSLYYELTKKGKEVAGVN